MVPTNFRAGDFVFNGGDKGVITEWSLRADSLGFAAERFVAPQLQAMQQGVVRGLVSELHYITFSEEELRALDIHSEARLFAFSYPVLAEQELKVSSKDAKNSEVALLAFGGFMFFDSSLALKDVRAVMPSSDGDLRFAPPQAWLPEWTSATSPQRWRPVTLPAHRAAGARYFTWLRPFEKLAGSTLCKHGGFAFIFHEPTESFVLQAQLDVYFPLVDTEVEHGKGCPKCKRILEWSNYSEGDYARGWQCENVNACKQECTPDNTMRWFCSSCHTDLCEGCYASLETQGQARMLLQGSSSCIIRREECAVRAEAAPPQGAARRDTASRPACRRATTCPST